MNRKLWSVCLAMILLLALIVEPQVSRAEGNAAYALSIPASGASVGQEVTVTLKGENLADLYGYEAVIEYDASKLSFKAAKSSIQGSGFSITPSVNGNQITFAFTKVGKEAGLSGNAELGTFTFQARAVGSADIKLIKLLAVSPDSLGTRWTEVRTVTAQIFTSDSSESTSPGVGAPASPPVSPPASGAPVEKVSGGTAELVASSAQRLGAKLLAAPVKTDAVAENGGYLQVSIEVPAGIDMKKATGVLFNPATGELTFVPTVFGQAGGVAVATIKHSGNGIYTVIEHSKTFADMSGHWAKAEVELLASKLLVNGRADEQFVPQGDITRAEFAALLVRGLGLSPAPAAAAFKDVASSDWHAGYVGAAVKAGLVEGMDAGIFAPNSNITREQMAVMISRAMQAAGKPQAAKVKNLEAFTDEGLMSSWAKEGISQSVEAGLLNGKDSQLFIPSSNATRAEAAVVLKRLLQYAELMN
ncbi:S-layer homology domain-containing protein [Paenibacillus sp. YN15]|uniref:S-layer homology domain-containing protein n=1 Tax=Paenibacillus sp. YN15 TaxID=1742774 RepID=UPI000DCCE420|nr:S-layer homology domain-containing protein [Paenibacillus sp. YN15]RAU98929.1 hypothetical protein DQG13_16895 [Paenibacillus sp. YN15]